MSMLHIDQQQKLKDALGIGLFIITVIIGAWLINAVVFRSFSVTGPSMEPTMYTNDRLIVNRLPASWNALQGKPYLPSRGHVIVFKNPLFNETRNDEYVVKRVIGLPGDRVVVSGGNVTIYNTDHPSGFNPYNGVNAAKSSVSGATDTVVGVSQIFVIGDNHSAQESLDSRNGLGMIPLDNIVGPVSLRIYPFNKASANF